MKKRPRINRWTQSRRDLIFSSSIKSSLVQPHFVVAGEGRDEEIDSMPGVNRQSVDVLMETIAKDMDNGISSHMLFGVVDHHEKDPLASKASDLEMPLQIAVSKLKEEYGNNFGGVFIWEYFDGPDNWSEDIAELIQNFKI